MNDKQRNILMLLMALGASALTAAPNASAARSQPAATSTPATSPSTDPIVIDVAQIARQLGATLADPSLPQAQRDEAAHRLMNLSIPAADEILRSTLAEQNAGGQIAVARALAEDLQPDSSFINPLFAAMGSNRTVTEAAAAALGNYRDNGEVLRRLIDLAANRTRGNEIVRAAAVRAVGSFSEKRAAEALLAVLRNPEELAALRRIASDALADLSGVDTNGTQVAAWDQWWAANSQKSDVQFRVDMLTRKSVERDRAAAHMRRLTPELEYELREKYLATPLVQHEELLLRWLKSAEPEFRARAAAQIREDFTEAKTFSEPVLQQLRSMIGDSDAMVRQQVTLAFTNHNDPPALTPLLQQLAHEGDPTVRLQIANALKNMSDVRAAPALLQLLNDSSPEVMGSAVIAFAGIGDALQQQDPALAAKVAATLQTIVDRTSGLADADQVVLRAGAIEALASLKQGNLITLYLKLLNPSQEPPRVRIAALKGLGALRNHNASDAIVACIDDPDDSVTLAAVNSLNEVSPSADQLERLIPLLAKDVKRDPKIREAAGHVLESSLPTLTKEQLSHWAYVVSGDPNRQLLIRKQLLKLQLAAQDGDGAATTQAQIAQNYIDLNQPDSAVPFYRAALEFRQSQNDLGMRLDQLMEGYTNALLASDKYPEAITFAANTIHANNARRDTFGPLICARVEQLAQSQQADQLKKAKSLVDLAKKMDTPLAEQHVDRLNSAEKTIDKRLNDLNQAPSGPRSASGATPPVTPKPSSVAGGRE